MSSSLASRAVAASFGQLILGVSQGPLAVSLRRLPRLLGVADRAGRWAFAELQPVVFTPGFLGNRAPSAVRVHHAACFWGLARDRLSDAEAHADAARFVPLLLTSWRAALRARVGARRATALTSQANHFLEDGLRLERALFARGRASLAEYVTCLELRTAWFNVTPLLHLTGARRRAGERALQRLMVSLQLVDDAVDAALDARHRGHSWPELLGLTPAHLVAAAVDVARQASALSARAGHWELSRWCAQRAVDVRGAFAVAPGTPAPPMPASSPLW